MIKYILAIVLVSSVINTANAQDSWISYNGAVQPVPVSVSVPVSVIQYVPIVVQKEVVVNTWGFRPILTPNFVIYPNTPVVPYVQYVPYYTRPCCLRPWVRYGY